MAAEIYAPSLPFITRGFAVNTTLVQLSISCFLFGMAIPGIFFGYISDYIGRRKVLLVSAVISLSGTVLCCLAPGIYWLIAGRIIQGIGFSGVGGIGRAILRDKFRGLELAKYAAYLAMAIALSIDLAPFIGGFLQQYFGWRAIFLLVAVYNLIVIYMSYQYQESQKVKPSKIQWNQLFRAIKFILSTPGFMRYNLIAAMVYSIFIAYIAVASFIVQNVLGQTPIWFGFMTLVLSLVFILSCFINGRLLRKLQPVNLIKLGFWILIVSVILLLMGKVIKLNLSFFCLAILPIFIGSAFVFSNSDALAFHQLAKKVGVAAALFSSIRLFFGMSIGAIISLFDPSSTFPLGSIIGALAGIGLILIYTVKNPPIL